MELRDWLNRNCKFAKKDRLMTTSAAVFREGKDGLEVLIGKRGSNPFKGAWALPGGRVDEHETLREAAERELEEETGIKTDLVYVESKLRYPGEDRQRVDAVFANLIEDGQKAEASDDIEAVKWVKYNDLPDMAFGHADSIRAAKKVMETPPGERGKLIVFEGIDGSGKSTQVDNLRKWLEENGYPAEVTKWNSSWLMEDAIKEAKDERMLSPRLYFLLHAADMVHRYEDIILPALARNDIVVCDRYFYTSMVRDAVRGIDSKVVRDVYDGLRHPDTLFYCCIEPEEAFKRAFKKKDGEMAYYAAGMDLGLSDDPKENCKKYEQLMHEQYESIMPGERNLHRLDMTESEDEIAKEIVKRLDLAELS